MPLDKTQARMDALTLAAEGRLFTDQADYFVGSELADSVKPAQPPIADAADDLSNDGDLQQGDQNGPDDLFAVVLTEAGAALRDQWSQE
ncbi:hypothetical protein [Amycolatopsis kentuckyensis]|uniref:hypothetical protein n=1 Tax=Amycolatopsis kentuckyensis TaxID=218823 RepID=UPI00356734B6